MHHVLSTRVVYGHADSHIGLIIGTPDILYIIPDHFYRHQVLSWPEQTGALDPEGAEHTDMSPRMNAVDPYFGHFGHRIEGQFQLLSFDRFGKFHPLSVPG